MIVFMPAEIFLKIRTKRLELLAKKYDLEFTSKYKIFEVMRKAINTPKYEDKRNIIQGKINNQNVFFYDHFLQSRGPDGWLWVVTEFFINQGENNPLKISKHFDGLASVNQLNNLLAKLKEGKLTPKDAEQTRNKIEILQMTGYIIFLVIIFFIFWFVYIK